MESENKEYIGKYVNLLEEKITKLKEENEMLKGLLEEYKKDNTKTQDRTNPYVCRCLPNTSCLNTYCPNRVNITSDYTNTETGY